jgi:leucyl aminopeptidase
MEEMKSDMAGAAVALAIMEAAAKSKLPVKIDAYIPVAENAVGRYAYKPGDILVFNNKKSVEITNTDAEGRLILADALIMAAGNKHDFIVEMSTLTGSIIKALGESFAGIMGNNEKLVSRLLEAARITGERLWEMPQPEDYKESIKSKIADMKNSGYGPASAIKAGLFLTEFVGDTPFAHIDIAGAAFLSKPNAIYLDEGATGFGVRLLIEMLRSLPNKK